MLAQTPVTDASSQLFLPLFTDHEIQAWSDDLRRREALALSLRARRLCTPNPRVRFVPDKASSSFWDIDDQLLDLPLGGPQEGNELNCLPGQLDEHVHEDSQESEDHVCENWSDDAVAQLHEAVLLHSLKALQARGNATEKRDVLHWIFAPTLMVAKFEQNDATPVEVLLPQHSTPFSFEMCCRFCGYHPQQLRDGLVPILNEIGLTEIFKEFQ